MSEPLTDDERLRLDALVGRMDRNLITPAEFAELEDLQDRQIDTELPWLRPILDLCARLAEDEP